MKTETHIKSAGIERFLHFRPDRRILIYLVCVLVSTFFWILNSLDKNYTTSVSLPVIYKGFPAGKIVLNDLPSTIKINLTAKGFNLIPITVFTNNSKLSIDLSQIKFNKNGEEFYRIPAHDLFDQVRNNFSQNVKINNLFPDTISFVLSEKYSKKIPVIPLYSIKFDNQFNVSDTLVIKPKYIRIYGPKKELENIKYISTDSIFLDFPETSQTIKINLKKYLKFIELEYNQVDVTIPIEKFTEKKLTVPIKATNMPDSIEIKTFPESAELTILTPLSKYDLMNESQFRISVNFNDASQQHKTRLPLLIDKKPEFVIVNYIKPEKVEFIIKKK